MLRVVVMIFNFSESALVVELTSLKYPSSVQPIGDAGQSSLPAAQATLLKVGETAR